MEVSDRLLLGRTAAKAALSLRRRLGIQETASVCPFDVAERMAIDVWIRPESSLEGLYVKEPPSIVVSNCRPLGRRRYNCAHELGHHEFKHGTRVDALREVTKSDPEEVLADSFAGHFLLPSAALRRAMAERGWRPDHLTSMQALRLSHLFGVGYSALLTHASHSLRQIPKGVAQKLLDAKPIDLRNAELGEQTNQPAYFLDFLTESTTIDCEVGDLAVLPVGSRCEGRALGSGRSDDQRTVFHACTPGIARVLGRDGGAVFVRVARRKFAGLARFRHLEDSHADK